MNNVLKLGKKIFTFSVVATTIVWSLGVAALVPSVAQAADACPTGLVSGDTVKVGANPKLYVLGADLKVMAGIDNQVTTVAAKKNYFSAFKSWRTDEGYGTIKNISVDCFSALGMSSKMFGYRPGAQLLKHPVTLKLMVVLPNRAWAYISDAAATALYGYKTSMVFPAFNENDFLGSLDGGQKADITEAVAHDGMFVLSNGVNYYVDGSQLKPITAAGVAANSVKASLIRTVPVTGLTISSTNIDAYIAGVGDRTGTGMTGGTTLPPSTGTLTVSLSAATAASASVPKNGSRVPFVSVNVTAGATAATVDTLMVKRAGLSAYTDLTRVWAEKDGIRVSSQQTVNSNDEATLNFSPVLTIPAGQSVKLDIVASLSDLGTGNMSLGVSSVGGTYVYGNTMSLISYSVATVNLGEYSTTKTVKVGDTYADLTSFDFQPNKNVTFKSIVLKNSGNEDMSKVLANVYLEKGGNVVSDFGIVNGRFITFNLKSGGLLVEKNDNVTFKVKGDVIAKENTSDPALSFTLYKAEDLSAVEQATGFGASLVDTAPFTLNNVNFTAGSITITKKAASPSDTDVIRGSKQVVALIANVKADEAISSEGLKLIATGTGIASSSFENAKVTLNGYSLGTVTPATTMTFDSSFTLNKGDNELIVYVDVATDATVAVAGKTIKVSVSQLSTNAMFYGMSPEYVQSGNSVSDINGSPEGRILTVQGADLTVSKNDGYTDTKTIVRGSTQSVLVKYNVKALYDAVKITSIEITPGTQTDYISTAAVTNMGIFADGAQVGTTRSYANATFSNVNYTIAKDATKPFEVRADFDSTSTGTIKFTVKFNFEDSRSKTGDETGQTSLITVAAAGTLTISADASKPDAGIVLAKAGVENTIAAFKISALKDLANITELTFDNNSVTTSDSRVASYKLYKGTTLLGTENPTDGVTTFKLADKLIVAANTSDVITLKAVFNTIDDRANTAALFKARLIDLHFKSSSGAEDTSTYTSLTYACNTMELRKTVPTFAAATPGAGEVLKFTITADSNEDVVITKLAFSADGSGAASTTGYTLWDGPTNVSSTINGTTTPTFDGLAITVGKGLSKTITLKANTSNVAVDRKVAVTLDRGTAGADIAWQEVFVDGGNVDATGALLNLLPISYEKTY